MGGEQREAERELDLDSLVLLLQRSSGKAVPEIVADTAPGQWRVGN